MPEPVSATKATPCPICRKPAVHTERPFCSKRCREMDLLRWLNGDYAIPATESEEDTVADDEAGSE